MRTTLLQLTLLLAFAGSVWANNGKAQDILEKKVTINQTNVELKQVLQELQRTCQVNFVYSSAMIRAYRKVSVTASGQKLAQLLEQVLTPLKLRFEVSGDAIVIKRLNDPPAALPSPPASLSEQEATVAGKPLQVSITGKVTDDKGQGIAGVSVKIKGSETGTTTNTEGIYSIAVPDRNAVLVFTHVGFLTIEKTVGDAIVLNVEMGPQDNNLDAVVVVGYGTQKKINLTGAVATVSGQELNKRVVTNPASLLQGKLPGLSVIENSGEPGNEGISLRIRGSGTFSNAGNEPFVVIDGVPGNLSAINPNDIQSISILKDAASAAIYGARAANGVILVTTKKGTEGKFSLEYSYNAGITRPSRTLDLITNSVEYMELFNRAAAHSGVTNRYSDSIINLYRNPTDPRYGNVDWQNDVLFNTVTTHNHYLSGNGGKGGTTYNLGIGFVDQPGVMLGFEYKKYTFQLGLNSAINKRVTLGLNLNMNYNDRKYPRQGATEQYLGAITQAPLYGPYVADGSDKLTNTNSTDPSNLFHNKNPIAVAKYVRAYDRAYNAIANLSLKVNLIKGLNWETRGGINYSSNKVNDFRPLVPTYNYYTSVFTGNLDVGANGLTITDNNSINTLVYSQLTYNERFGDHNFNVLAGAQAEYNKTESLNGFRKGFLDNQLRELNGGGQDGQTTGGFATEWALQSLYGRLTYDYKGKYLFETNARYDGSSRFSPGNRWQLYPSASLGWRISQESFMAGIDWLTDLKLRGSWGRLGNQNVNSLVGGVGPYPYQDLLDVSSTYPLDNSGNLTSGATRTALVDKNIKWETTQIFDLGADVSLFNNKLSITADWFDKRTYDILRAAQVPGYTGLTQPIINGGTMQNKGWEFTAQYSNKLGDFTYSIGGNYQQFTNKLLKFGVRQINATTINQEGTPYNSFYLLEWIGVFQSQDEINNSPKQQYTPKPGDLKFKDQNKDGFVNADDRVIMDGAYAKFNYSLNLNLGYKDFDFTAFFYGVQGQKQYVQRWGAEPFTQGTAPTTDWRNAWTPENKSNTKPALYVWPYLPMTNPVSNYFLQDASFFRIKNIQIGYNVPDKLLRRIGISSLRLYVSGDNLHVFTNYPFLDPERTPVSGQNTAFINYPQNKIYSFGARVKF